MSWMTPGQRGGITEAKIFAALVAGGYHVVLPNSICRWDIGWEEDGKLIRVQCKTGRIKNGKILFETTSRSNGGVRRPYHGQIEFFAIYVYTIDKVYLIPISFTNNYECSLRLSAPKNKQQKKILWAKDFELQSCR